ncbi:hypothetical protein [Paenibacillus sp. MER TA 81-3]|uniref:hypothetical protein n=1 Tax=Paenibacillus sp. MER TA 81-3 TaxID=2939573 RepID=UPI002041DADF|nr:hypothetical protein [Paenibacillus sp. MER TA 81-3]
MKMNKSLKITLGLTTLAIILSVSMSSVSKASIPDIQEAKNTVENYIEAIESKNVDEIMKWVKDTRFDSPAQQRSQYFTMFSNDPFSNASMINIQKINNNTMSVSIELDRKSNKESEIIQLPVIKEDGKWKLLVAGVETKE